jgi:hypothetical protein
MKKNKPIVMLFVIIVSGALYLSLTGQMCETQSGSIVGYRGGDTSTIAVMDGVSNDVSGQHLRLKAKGANFVPSSNYPVTTNLRITCAAADFNGDGRADLVQGGQRTDYNTDASLGNLNANDSNLSIFPSRGVDPVTPTRFLFDGPYYILYSGTALNATYQMISNGAGDFDGDGDADFAALSWSGKLWIFKNLFKENAIPVGGVPVFSPPTLVGDLINDGYGEWGQSATNWRWTSTQAVVDIDKDGDLDLIIGVSTQAACSRWGEVVIFINNGSGTFSRLVPKSLINPYPTDKYGVTGVAAADFNGDGYVDFYVGSSSSRDLLFYQNDGLGNFKNTPKYKITIPAGRGACSSLVAGDMDQDGLPDMVLSTDGAAGTNVPGGYVYWLKNNGNMTFTMNCVPTSCAQVSSSGDLDAEAVADFDNDGDLDFFVADGNDSLRCYFFMNDIFPIYVSQGTTSSKNLLECSFLTSDNAVVSATITVIETKPLGTKITYYLSNSDDQSGNPKWEGPVTPGVEYTFESPGSFLRWKAVLETTNENTTPKIHSLSLNYKYITKREYSRTSHALTTANVNAMRPGDEDVLYSASFEFPTWKGHLRSWDVTSLTLPYSKSSDLRNIANVGAKYVADAGEALSTRSWSTRIVYTVYDRQGDDIMNDRTDFSIANKALLESYLGLGVGSPETEPLIRFVLGDGRAWKLGDINHSSPQVLEPPYGTASQMGDGYAEFKEANKNRQRVIIVGANDGMLHCFDTVNMNELWAFIPNNLLYKLKSMRVKDPDCGVFLFHHYFIDGSPVIHDIYYGGAWHTVLVGGQGMGWGRDHGFYYFALDVTDPMAPIPMWELTDPTMGETWSVPHVGKVDISGTPTWLAFMGSGYDTWDPTEPAGNYVYAVDIATGQILKSFEIKETGEPASPFGIVNTVPGSPNGADNDRDGDIEYIYFGDLLGRFWKIDLTTGVNQWKADVIYRDPYYHPIVTKPAVYVDLTTSVITLYFGTGGDEKAPGTEYYSFVALKDGGATGVVQWYLGPADLAVRLGIDNSLKKGDFNQGEKIWADDVIADRLVYIATLTGNIENLNPCITLSGSGRIYSRYIQGSQTGGSALIGASGTAVESMVTAQKVRSAVTVGKLEQLTQEGSPTINKRLVFIQSYTQAGGARPEPPSEVLAQPVPIYSRLSIKSWREVYKIIR